MRSSRRQRAAAQFVQWRNEGHPMRVTGEVAAKLVGDDSLKNVEFINLSTLAVLYTK